MEIVQDRLQVSWVALLTCLCHSVCSQQQKIGDNFRENLDYNGDSKLHKFSHHCKWRKWPICVFRDRELIQDPVVFEAFNLLSITFQRKHKI